MKTEYITIPRKERPDAAAQKMVEAQGKFNIQRSGCYARVYISKKSDVVYKVGPVLDNDGYLAYNLCIKYVLILLSIWAGYLLVGPINLIVKIL